MKSTLFKIKNLKRLNFFLFKGQNPSMKLINDILGWLQEKSMKKKHFSFKFNSNLVFMYRIWKINGRKLSQNIWACLARSRYAYWILEILVYENVCIYNRFYNSNLDADELRDALSVFDKDGY